MRIDEIANAQEQLELLRLIIDNTWTAIKQQADIQARQQASKPRAASVKPPKPPKRPPYAAKPKPLPKPTATPQQQAKHQQLQQNQLVNQLHTAITKSQSPNSSNAKRDTEMGSATQKF
jgi:hypothetical protein